MAAALGRIAGHSHHARGPVIAGGQRRCVRIGHDIHPVEAGRQQLRRDAVVRRRSLPQHHGQHRALRQLLFQSLGKVLQHHRLVGRQLQSRLIAADGIQEPIQQDLVKAQLGALRDLDYGIYPYTTSSNTIAAFAPVGSGLPGASIDEVVGVVKAYSSCVGEGPFTTELAMTEEEKDVLREHGHEYGAATGRPRRVGPFDAVASRYGVQCQGCDELALTLLDVLDYMEEVPIVTAYKLTDGSTTTRFPMGKTLDDAQPVVETVPGWHCDITGVRKFEDLPQAAQDYVTRLEELVGCKIKYISVGPERDACIVRE